MSPSQPQRKQVRIQGFDYSQPGAYFLTIVTHHRPAYFGNIEHEEMNLNPAGQMLDFWWQKIPETFSCVSLDEYCIMPNHFHATVMLHDGDHPEEPLPQLHTIVQWYKTMTTNAYIRGVHDYGWLPFSGKLWQRSYYEHIIRDEADFERVREYIVNNPLQWALDAENPGVK